MKKAYLSLICGSSLCLIAATASAQTTTILSENWADGNRTNQDLPNSSAWFSPTNGTMSATEGSMTSSAAGGTRYALTYFTSPVGSAAPSPVSVGVGQMLTISYNYSFTGISTSGTPWLRVGVYNSSTGTKDPKRISSDSDTLNNDAYVGYTGYMLDQTNLRTGGTVNLRRRNSAGSNNLMTANGAFTNSIGENVSGFAYANSTDEDTFIYSAVMTIAHIQNDLGEDIVIITQNVYDDENKLLFSRSATDTAGVWEFDTLAFAITNTVESMTFYNVDISLGQIPEPSTYAAIGAGAALLVGLGLRRRQRGKAGSAVTK